MFKAYRTIQGQFYKGIIGKYHYKWSFSYNSIVKCHGTKNREQQHEHVVSRGCGVI